MKYHGRCWRTSVIRRTNRPARTVTVTTYRIYQSESPRRNKDSLTAARLDGGWSLAQQRGRCCEGVGGPPTTTHRSWSMRVDHNTSYRQKWLSCNTFYSLMFLTSCQRCTFAMSVLNLSEPHLIRPAAEAASQPKSSLLCPVLADRQCANRRGCRGR